MLQIVSSHTTLTHSYLITYHLYCYRVTCEKQVCEDLIISDMLLKIGRLLSAIVVTDGLPLITAPIWRDYVKYPALIII